MPVSFRSDFDPPAVRAAAKRSKDGPQTRRLLALAAIYDGATRTQAPAMGGVTLQIVRDWRGQIQRLGARWSGRPQGAWTIVPAQRHASGSARDDHRERTDPGHSWRRALAHHRSVPMDVRRVCRFD